MQSCFLLCARVSRKSNIYADDALPSFCTPTLVLFHFSSILCHLGHVSRKNSHTSMVEITEAVYGRIYSVLKRGWGGDVSDTNENYTPDGATVHQLQEQGRDKPMLAPKGHTYLKSSAKIDTKTFFDTFGEDLFDYLTYSYILPILNSGIYRVTHKRRHNPDKRPTYQLNMHVLNAVLYDWDSKRWLASDWGRTGCRLCEYLVWERPEWIAIQKELVETINDLLHALALEKDKEKTWTTPSPFLQNRLASETFLTMHDCRFIRLVGQCATTKSYTAGRPLSQYVITDLDENKETRVTKEIVERIIRDHCFNDIGLFAKEVLLDDAIQKLLLHKLDNTRPAPAWLDPIRLSRKDVPEDYKAYSSEFQSH